MRPARFVFSIFLAWLAALGTVVVATGLWKSQGDDLFTRTRLDSLLGYWIAIMLLGIEVVPLCLVLSSSVGFGARRFSWWSPVTAGLAGAVLASALFAGVTFLFPFFPVYRPMWIGYLAMALAGMTFCISLSLGIVRAGREATRREQVKAKWCMAAVTSGLLLVAVSPLISWEDSRIELTRRRSEGVFCQMRHGLAEAYRRTGSYPAVLGTIDPFIAERFPHGFVYESNGASCRLSAARISRYSFFTWDRMVFDSRTGAHWQGSGKEILPF